jgi:16S rRNA (cytidine1402-2'-O)-methyltransferase
VDKGIRVTAAPGAAAAVVALVISGLPTDAFSFAGFLPSRAGARRQLLEEWRNRPETLVFYESPHRLTEALLDLEDVLGGSRPMVAARELTKLHEEAVRGTIAEVRRHFEAQPPRGEFVLVVQGKTAEAETAGETEQDLATRMRELLAQPEMDEKRALKQLAREWGIGRSDLYRRWQRVKSPG